jgi:hypothetical protein
MTAGVQSVSETVADTGEPRVPVHAAARRDSARMNGRLALAAALLITLLALPPRLVDLDRFVTTDELFWMGRSGNFARALAAGQLPLTFQSGHPGVTTMWTAMLGVGPGAAQELGGPRREISRRDMANHPSFLPYLAGARLGFSVATALAIGLIAVVAWRLLGPGPAVLGGCLLALDPFVLAHSRLVHIDASLALWTTLAAVAGLLRWSGGGPATLALCGVATALALLSKAPAAFLFGFLPASAIWVRGWAALTDRSVWHDLAIWATASIAIYVALWPAMWVAPFETLGLTVGFVRDNANPSHAAAAGDGVGVLFYPLVFLVRTTPLTLLGLFLLAVFRPDGQVARVTVALALYAVGFGLAMTFAAKNVDRYLLPAFPALDLLAGLGLWQSLGRLVSRPRGSFAVASATAVVVAVTSWSVLSAWPYGVTYANPLVGGVPFANTYVASGWGEGLDQVASYLNRQPDAARLRVGMPGEIYTTVLDAQFVGQVTPAEGSDAGAYDYFVVYTRNLQIDERPQFFDERYLRWPTDAAVTLGGVEYARIYKTDRGAPVGAVFGDRLVLDGYGVSATTIRPGGGTTVRLRWRRLDAAPDRPLLGLELRDHTGAVVAQTTAPLPTDELQGDSELPLQVGAGVSPGEYALVVRVLDSRGSPLRHAGAPPPGPLATGLADALGLRSLRVR